MKGQVSVEKRHRKSATMADNEALRVVLSSIYHMVESIRRKDLFEMVIPQEKKEAFAMLRNCFIAEIGMFLMAFLYFYNFLGFQLFCYSSGALTSLYSMSLLSELLMSYSFLSSSFWICSMKLCFMLLCVNVDRFRCCGWFGA